MKAQGTRFGFGRKSPGQVEKEYSHKEMMAQEIDMLDYQDQVRRASIGSPTPTTSQLNTSSEIELRVRVRVNALSNHQAKMKVIGALRDTVEAMAFEEEYL